MRFKDNLLKKIEIDRLAEKVFDTIGPPDSGIRADLEAMSKLLEMGSYQAIKERDLTLYILEGTAEHGRLFVLDNELAIYDTSAEDVGIRKSPTVKEMVTIRNIKKILVDSDIVVSKKEASVKTIQKACIDMLDLSYDASDIEAIASEGIHALEVGNTEDVRESLILFSELLGYQSAPKPFELDHHDILGHLSRGDNNELFIAPVIIYSPFDNRIRLLDIKIGSFDKEKIELIQNVVDGAQHEVMEGRDVFQYLSQAVVSAIK